MICSFRKYLPFSGIPITAPTFVIFKCGSVYAGTEGGSRQILDPAGTLTDLSAPTRDPYRDPPVHKLYINRDPPALGSHFCH